MPKVSVLMPVYNAQSYVSEAIESILSQNYSDWELIIINDGSTDESENIIRSFSDNRIRYFKNSENKGLIYTRNLLIEKSSGEYVAFLDSDDISMPKRLQYQVEFLDNNLSYGLCGTWGIMIDENGREIKHLNLTHNHDEIRCNLLFGNSFIQSSIMIRKSVLEKEAYDKNFTVSEDYELWCRLSLICKLSNIPKHLTKYRWHGTNISKEKEDLINSLAKIIYRRELVNLAIYASDYEIDLHSSIKDKNSFDIPDDEFFDELKFWLQKLVGANQLCRTYNHDAFLATVCFRWIYACKERGSILRAFFLPVSPGFGAFIRLIKMLYARTK